MGKQTQNKQDNRQRYLLPKRKQLRNKKTYSHRKIQKDEDAGNLLL
jgi:hypothetical protein